MAKAAKTTAIPGSVMVSIMGATTIEGQVTLNENGSATVLYKKPRSPKMITQIVPAGNFIAAVEGEEGMIVTMGMTDLLELSVDDINASIEIDGNTMTVTDSDGDVTVIDTSVPGLNVAIEGEPQDAADKPAASGKRGRPAKAKEEEAKPAKGKGKAKAEVEDDDDEDDDDEEEEAKPAKGKGGKGKAKEEAKPAKGKGGKGKAKADDEWEDE